MANENGDSLKMGIIVCNYCGIVVDTVYTEKVVTFYSHCGNSPCVDLHMNAYKIIEQIADDC